MDTNRGGKERRKRWAVRRRTVQAFVGFFGYPSSATLAPTQRDAQQQRGIPSSKHSRLFVSIRGCFPSCSLCLCGEIVWL
jgi:hypothetical protein